GKLKALAVTGERRSLALPDVPTMAEAGVKDFETSGSYGISVPKGTLLGVVKKLNLEAVTVMRVPDITEKIHGKGVEPRPGPPEKYLAHLRAEFEKYRVLLPRLGMKPE